MQIRDTRQQSRDSLFLVAPLRMAENGPDHEVKLRNISDAGVMAQGSIRAARGQAVWVSLRNVGWVEGRVAWAAGDRCGIAFVDAIDSARVQFPVQNVDLPDPAHHGDVSR